MRQETGAHLDTAQQASFIFLKLLVCAVLSYECMRPEATSLFGLKATSVCGLQKLAHFDTAQQSNCRISPHTLVG